MTDTTFEHQDQSQNLDGNPFFEPATPLTVRVRLERWDGDNATEIGSVSFDGRAVFDAEPLSTVANDLSDLDWVLYSAIAAGLVDEHEGPFTVEAPEDLDEYIAHRENAGMTEANPSAAKSLAAARRVYLAGKLEETLSQVERLREAIKDAELVDKTASELAAGDTLVHGAQRIRVRAVAASTLLPGLMAVETVFGILHLDADREIRCKTAGSEAERSER